MSLKYNSSGYYDPTMGQALTDIEKEEKAAMIEELRKIAKQKGFEILGKVVLRTIEEDGND